MILDSSLIVYIVLGLVLILAILHIRLELRMRTFLIGTKAKNLDETLAHIRKELHEYLEFKVGAEDYLKSVERRLRKSVQGVNTVRFNPFQGTGAGGNQSFATAFLNQEGDGVIISSLYGRDHVSVFAKPVVKFTTKHELSTEEKEALESAKAKLERIV